MPMKRNDNVGCSPASGGRRPKSCREFVEATAIGSAGLRGADPVSSRLCRALHGASPPREEMTIYQANRREVVLDINQPAFSAAFEALLRILRTIRDERNVCRNTSSAGKEFASFIIVSRLKARCRSANSRLPEFSWSSKAVA